MKKIVPLIFYFAIGIINSSFSQGSWTTQATFAGAMRAFATGFSIGTKGYIVTGNNFDNLFWEWDQPTNTWSQKANFPGATRDAAASFSIGTKGYIGLGSGIDFWEWDQATNTWTAKANFGGATGMTYAVGFSIGAKGYVGAGYSGGWRQDFWQYDQVTDTWTQKANFGGGLRTLCVGFSIGSKGYIGLGCDPNGWPIGHNDLWEYDTTANSWTQKANFPSTGRCEASAFTIGNYGYVGVGTTYIGVNDTTDIWRFDPTTNSWAQAANYGGSLVEMASTFSIGCFGYIVTGYTNDMAPFNQNLWQYYDSTNTTCGTSCALAANFKSSDTAFCSESGKCINFTDLSSPCATSWHWRFPGAAPDSSNQQNPTNICYYVPGTYPVTLIVTNGLDNDSLAVTPLIIFANLPPPPTINVIGGDTLVSSHASYYQWYFNGSPVAGATDSFYVAHQGGTYSVQITDSLGCNSLSNGVVITDVPNTLHLEQGIRIYPNPARDQFEVLGLKFEVGAIIEIYTVLGEKVYSQQFKTTNIEPQTINCKSFAAGIYFIKVANEKVNFVGKFVKE